MLSRQGVEGKGNRPGVPFHLQDWWGAVQIWDSASEKSF